MDTAVQEFAAGPAAAAGTVPATGTPLVSLLGATFDTGNLGVSALASGTITAIRSGFPNARIRLLDYGKPDLTWINDTEHGRLEQVNLRFSKQPWLPNHVVRLVLLAFLVRLVPERTWRSRLARQNPWLRKIAEFDCHLSLAGGDSFSDIYGLRRLIYMALPQILVLLLERPLVLLPQTYGPFKSRFARVLAGCILRRARGVYSRDKEGLTVVSGLLRGRGPLPRLACDMGFGLEPRPPAPEVMERLRTFKQSGPLIGFNISGLLYIGGYRRNNQFGLKSDYADVILALLDLLVAGYGVQALLVPHVYAEEKYSEGDREACREIALKFGPRYPGRLHTLEGTFDHRETKHIIGACDFFLGSRMHACIASLSQCIPTVGLAYSRKFAGVMELVGDEAVVVDLRSLEVAEIVTVANAAWRNREATRRQLLARIPAIRESARGLFQQPEFQDLLKTRHA